MFSSFIFSLISSFFAVLRVAPPAGSFPRPLTCDEEKAVFERMQKGDREAKNELIEHNLRLVAHVVKKYCPNPADQDDLISIGTIGLIKAAGSYSESKSTRFATYACRCVENEILMYFRSQKKESQKAYLSDPIESDRDGNQLCLMDILKYPDTMAERISAGDLRQELSAVIEKCLSGKDREIIELRYGLWDRKPLTQRECAQKLGISRSYVSRIEKRALERLRSKIVL